MIQAANKLKLLRRELGRTSILEFAQFYFSHYMTSQSCSFHEEISDILMNMAESHNGRLAVAAPRGHAKSTVVSFFYVMWSICYEKEKFVLILSATAKQAQTLLADITKALETNSKLLDDFSDVFIEKDGVKSKWTQDEIITKNGVKITALGSGQDLRGLKKYQDRPTLIIFDDVDSAKNTYNALAREKILNWFTRDVMKAGALKGFNAVAVGTLLHPDSLLSRLTKREEFPDWNKKIYKAVIKFSDRKDLWQQWGNILFGREPYGEEIGLTAADKFFEVHKQEMLEGTKVLWPEIEDYYKLMKIREIEGTYSFDSEKQNDPTNVKDSRYDPDKFYYWDGEFDSVEQLLASFGSEYSIIAACDPSVGAINTRADNSAIVVLAKYKGKLYVIDADITQRPQDDLVQAIINYCKIRRPMDKFIIEANLFPELLAKYVRERAAQENVLAPLTETRNTKNKELRIFGMETYITTGIIQFSRRHTVLLDQLKYFPRDAHDDGPDALEMALRGAELNNVTFLDLTEKRDKYGRPESHPDYGRPSAIDDTEDDDDFYDDGRGKMRGYSL